MGVNGLIYFVLGLLLVSQARLSALATMWHTRQTQVAAGLGKRWARYGLVFLGLLGALALLLPTGYSLTLLDATRLALIFLLNLIVQIFQVIWLLIVLGLSKLFPFEPDLSFAPQPLIPPSAYPITPDRPLPPFPWLEILRSLLFWWVFIFGIVYIARSYLNDHPELLDSLKRITPLWWVIGLVATVVVWTVELVRMLFKLAPPPVEPPAAAPFIEPARRHWHRTRLKRLTGRELVFYYYFDILHRAGRRGAARQRAETPLEYESRLGQLLPSKIGEIRLLTDAFLQARYSRIRPAADQLTALKTVWQQIQTALAEPETIKQTEPITPEVTN
jgi:hypothetical protein